ncbi:MAG TPA: HAD-IB family phosphatase [Candidatus Sulfotelmatobacter sp.]|jgi:HAD superfamily phosphoserine phosphatase-like hydrolase|nr:HAD-IB family phosphatase [Candidatus Sulfotelmatobacter sp.]
MSGEVEQARRVGAFFDIDGTLVPEPSLERRLFRELKRTGAIPWVNYLHWGAEAARLLPRGLTATAHGNKRYLRGLRAEQILKAAEPIAFFEEGVARVEWHARRGDVIVLVSGMVKPLARMVAMALECELEARGLDREVLVSATRLEESGGIFTGSVLGEANYGEAKRRAMEVVARAMQINLRESHAYGNTLLDRAMLGAVGHAHAVNPGKELAATANLRDWAIWHWHQEKKFASESLLKDRVKLQTIGTHL